MRTANAAKGLVLAFGLLLTATPARAVITALTPLKDVLQQSTFIVSATVDSVDADKPMMVLIVDDDLKGRSPVRRLPVLLKGDAEAKKKDHVTLLLKRVAPKVPLVLFLLQQDKKYTAFAYTNGSWFQITGIETDGVVRWSFTHGEPYLRKTFKGTTAELKDVVRDGLSGKKEPPMPDNKEKPGFGPEIEADKAKDKKQTRLAIGGEALFAVIPTVLVGGPLAILAMLFPAVFGGLTLVMRRWIAALTVLSMNSTLYLLQDLCGRWLIGSWWSTPQALWLTMMGVTLLGLLWAWRRHLARIAVEPGGSSAEAPANPFVAMTMRKSGITTGITPHAIPVADAAPTSGEIGTLAGLSISLLLFMAIWMPRSWSQWDTVDKTLLTLTAGLCLAALHALRRLWLTRNNRSIQPGLPGEGVLLWSLLLVGICFSVGDARQANGVLASEDEAGPASEGWQQRVAWRFRPDVERCWMASSPVVDGDRVYVGAVLPSAFKSGGAVYCVDRRTGQTIWTFNDGGSMKDVFSSPCVADGRVYVGEGFHQHAECKLYCLDAASGKKLWDFATASHTESSPSVSGGKVYFGAGDDGLFCLDAATGKEKWHRTGMHVDANPLVIDNRLYGGSGVGDAYKETMLFCLDADTGDEHWRMPVDLPVWGMPAARGEYLYAGLGNGNFLDSAEKPAGAVLCLERATGKRVWRYDVSDGVHVRTCVDERHVWFASRDRHCYCLDRREGTLRWKTDMGSPVVASPNLVGRGNDAGLYVAASAGHLCHLDAATGKTIWTFDVAKDAEQSAAVFSSPCVQTRDKDDARLIWFGCGLNGFTRGVLYCLEEKRSERLP